tara:strand:- start:3273 stop:3506 length:234 start_codon:yes stop_codon:yes gene_type:complete
LARFLKAFVPDDVGLQQAGEMAMQAVSRAMNENEPARPDLMPKSMDEKVLEILRILRDHGIQVNPVAVIDNDGNDRS